MSSVSDETDIEGAEEGFIDKGVNWISEEENKCTCESDCNDNEDTVFQQIEEFK